MRWRTSCIWVAAYQLQSGLITGVRFAAAEVDVEEACFNDAAADCFRFIANAVNPSLRRLLVAMVTDSGGRVSRISVSAVVAGWRSIVRNSFTHHSASCSQPCSQNYFE